MGRIRHLAGVLVAGALAMAAPAEAQDEDSRRASLVVGGGGSIGVLVPLTSGLALRPDLSYTRSNIASGASVSRDSWSWALGLGSLHYLSAPARTRIYVVPRIGYSWAGGDGGGGADTYSLSAAIGGHANVTGRLGLFVETGLSFTYSESRTPPLIGAGFVSTLRSYGTLGRFGGTLRF